MSDQDDDIPATPEALLARIQTGDVAAESELIRRYSRSLRAMLLQRTGDPDRADDVHQEAFLIVLERLRDKGLDDPGRVAAFLHRTALNVLIGDYRKESPPQDGPGLGADTAAGRRRPGPAATTDSGRSRGRHSCGDRGPAKRA